MSGSGKNSVGIVEWSEHLLIEWMVLTLPRGELAETLRCHSVVERMLVVASVPVPDVFDVLLLAQTDLTNLSVGLVLLL